MGVIQDILELVKDIKNQKYLDSDELQGVLNLKFGKNSISRKAGNAILQFPVLTSNVISVQDLTMVNKALERQYATFIRIAMGLDDSVENGSNKTDFIKRFHQNSGTKQQLRINGTYFQEGMEMANRPFAEDLRLESLNDMTNKGNQNNYILGKGNLRSLSEAPRVQVTNNHDIYNDVNPTIVNNISPPNVNNNIRITGSTGGGGGGPKISDKSQYTNQLLSNDIKKANELVPTTLDIAVFVENENGQPVQSNILMGIKTIAHLVDSEQMIFNIAKAVEEKRALFRFIQWTTGEIAFFKDYLFMIDRIRNEATSQRTDSHWWRSLKRRATESRIRRWTFGKKEILPNSTILITMDEVEYIANNYNIDLLDNTKAVRTLMDVFFLLGFVIVDPAAELAYFFFDGQTTYQTFSYNSLERENTSASEVKSIVSLMSRS
jgi:hypothetical protein